jgi:hypothetical protein
MPLSRRTFLRGAGALVALPFLDAMRPARVFAQSMRPMGPPPRRFLAWYVPCGIHMAAWTPASEGRGYELTPILQSLAPFKDDVLVLTGLANIPARPDGPGDHAGGTSAFLTARHAHKTEGADIQLGVSVDQLIAGQVGAATRFPSLVLGLEGGGNVGGCDSGYSCAYSRNISWAGPQTPTAKEIDPRAVFDRLFQGQDPRATREQIAKRRRYHQSILDFVREDATSLRTKLGAPDRAKLDEYLTGIRELEHSLQTADQGPVCDAGDAPAGGELQDQVRQMNDLMALAFQCDLTRLCTFMLGNGGSNRPYPFLGVNDGHHQISHHMNNPVNLQQLQIIDTWEMEQFAYLVGKLKAAEEGDGSLLDHSVLFFSSEIEDGNAHRHTNLPVVLAGKAGGAINPGRHVVVPGDRPIADLFLTLARACGATADTFGDNSTAPLDLT